MSAHQIIDSSFRPAPNICALAVMTKPPLLTFVFCAISQLQFLTPAARRRLAELRFSLQLMQLILIRTFCIQNSFCSVNVEKNLAIDSSLLRRIYYGWDLVRFAWSIRIARPFRRQFSPKLRGHWQSRLNESFWARLMMAVII